MAVYLRLAICSRVALTWGPRPIQIHRRALVGLLTAMASCFYPSIQVLVSWIGVQSLKNSRVALVMPPSSETLPHTTIIAATLPVARAALVSQPARPRHASSGSGSTNLCLSS
ncbi:hypothetical protein C8T65DRAFT_204241 [Cerioporus squamosus]|nr:hypothetical protein C8T65DRAFT_204241 [Cerioporus squamosus]